MRSALFSALSLVCFATLPAFAGPVAWTVPVLDRIKPDSTPRDKADVRMEGGRREIISFQVAVQASGEDLHDLRFSVTDLKSKSGAKIGGSQIVLYRENFVTLKLHSPTFKPFPKHPNLPLKGNVFPDALLPFIDPQTGKPPKHAQYNPQPISLPAGSDTAYWIDVSIPANTASGRYDGRYTVSAKEGSVSGAIHLDVLPFTVPLSPTLRSSMNSSTTNPPGETEELLRNKLMPNVVPLGDEPRLIETWGLDTEDLGFWGGAYYGHCKMHQPPSVEKFRRARASHDSRLFLYDFPADEIGKCHELFPLVKKWARRLHAAKVPNLITMEPVPDLLDDGSGSGRSAVDIWTVLPEEYVHAQTFDPPRITQVMDKGDSVWFYTALVQDNYSPKWEVDFLPLDFRLSSGLINESLGLTGILYWSVDYWTKHPWTDIEYPGGCYKGYCWSFPGEGFMVYPGKEVGLEGVASSLRLKYIRDGVQDYERAAILERCGHGGEAKDIARSVGRDYKNWTRSNADVFAASHKLGQLIVRYGCSP